MRKLLLMLAVLMGMVAYVYAGWGYCYKCRCSDFDRDHFAGDSSNWFCSCGHRYEDHLNASRPTNTSFSGRTVYYGGSDENRKPGFFDDGYNVLMTICGVIALIYALKTGKISAPFGVAILWLVKQILK